MYITGINAQKILSPCKNERECFQRCDEEGGANINGIAPTCI